MGSRTTNNTTTQQSGPPEFQVPHLQDVFNRARTLSQTPLQYPDFDQIATFTPAERSAQQRLLDYSRGGIDAPLARFNSGLDFATNNVLSPESNPYLRQTGDILASDISRDFSERILPAIGSEAASVGQVGGSRHGVAEGIAARGATEASANARTQLYNNAYNRGLSTFEQGLTLSPQAVALGAVPAQLEAAVGGQQRAQEQALLDQQTEEHWFNQMAPWQLLSQYLSLVGGNYGGRGDSVTQQPSTLWERIGLGNIF